MIRSLFRKFKVRTVNKSQRLDYISILDGIGKEINNNNVRKSPNIKCKILIGPSFSIYQPALIHDRLLSYSLRLKGAEIIPIYCDAVQSMECNVSGGVWSNGTFQQNCEQCIKCSHQLWDDHDLPMVKLSDFINEKDRIDISSEVDGLGHEEWNMFVHDNMPFGHWAKDILVNNYVVGDYHLVPNYHLLGVNHIKNLMLLAISYSRIIDHYQPDRVVANDSYYGMWAILQELCSRKNIPFYSHWGPVMKGRWAYGYNDASMNLNFSKPWENFSKLNLSNQQITKVNEWLNKRSEGKELLIDTASLSKYKSDEFDLNSVDFNKPTALLTANVIWDLAALNKQVVFKDMIDWIAETINWFGEHLEYQLIVKPHPAEQHPSIPETEERVEVALRARNIVIPKNVFLFSPKVKLTIYDLLPLIKVCLVHTTTVGIEAAAIGLPVITTGKSPYRGFGFTIDATDSNVYFNGIDQVLCGSTTLDLETQKDLAYKFILFYQYHYYTKIDIMDFDWGNEPRLKIDSAKDLLPGRNKHWDYIINTILSGLPILDKNRWPEES